ncbi:Histone-lysine N-methyltransferase SETD2 [Nymphon striatum]|nr:Histone-lysine N-methyltransferase SETD2 [Nymphon striatum]
MFDQEGFAQVYHPEVSSKAAPLTSRRRSTRIQIRRTRSDNSEASEKTKIEPVVLKNASKKTVTDSVASDNINEINLNENDLPKKVGRKPKRSNAKEKLLEKITDEKQALLPDVSEPAVTETPKPKVGRPRNEKKVSPPPISESVLNETPKSKVGRPRNEKQVPPSPISEPVVIETPKPKVGRPRNEKQASPAPISEPIVNETPKPKVGRPRNEKQASTPQISDPIVNETAKPKVGRPRNEKQAPPSSISEPAVIETPKPKVGRPRNEKQAPPSSISEPVVIETPKPKVGRPRNEEQTPSSPISEPVMIETPKPKVGRPRNEEQATSSPISEPVMIETPKPRVGRPRNEKQASPAPISEPIVNETPKPKVGRPRNEKQASTPQISDPVVNETAKPKVGRPRKNAKLVTNQAIKIVPINSPTQKNIAKANTQEDSEAEANDFEKMSSSSSKLMTNQPPDSSEERESEPEKNDECIKSDKKIEKLEKKINAKSKKPIIENVSKTDSTVEIVRRSRRKREGSEENTEVTIENASIENDDARNVEVQKAEIPECIHSDSCEDNHDLYDDLPDPDNELAANMIPEDSSFFEPEYATDEEGEESLSSSQSNSEDNCDRVFNERASRIGEQSWIENETKRPEKVKSRWRRSCELENLVCPPETITIHKKIHEESCEDSDSIVCNERTKNNSDLPTEPSSEPRIQSPIVSTKPITSFQNSPEVTDQKENSSFDLFDCTHNSPSPGVSSVKIQHSEFCHADSSSNDLISKSEPMEDLEKQSLKGNNVEASEISTADLIQNDTANMKPSKCDSVNSTISSSTFSNNIPVSSSSSLSSNEIKSDSKVANELLASTPPSACDISDKNILDNVKDSDVGELRASSSVHQDIQICTKLDASEVNDETIPSFSEPSEKIDSNKPTNEDLQFPSFESLLENRFISERKKSRGKKEVRRMQCDCYPSEEELENGVMTCGDDCLNRLLMIECGSRCRNDDLCANKRFQWREYVNVVPFKTEMKGFGLKTLEDISSEQFIIEYVGEVLNHKEFNQRVKQYSKEKCEHYYFMSLRADEILDATYAGNVSRFINHSCSPNVETQKWTVNGELRIGFFSKRNIFKGEELTFDYQFQRYGRQAQKCLCLSENCRGFIGGEKQVSLSKTTKVLPKKKKTAEEKKRELFEDMDLDMEVEKLNSPKGLKNTDDVLKLCRLMNTTEQACLRLFLDYHGLALIWSWMANIGEDCIEIKSQILGTLVILPIQNKTTLEESKVLDVVKRWAAQLSCLPELKDIREAEILTDGEASSSEPSSVAQSPHESSLYRPPSKKIKLDLHEAEIVHDKNATAHVFMCENIDINIDDIPLPPSPPPASSDYSFDTGASYAEEIKNDTSQCFSLPDSSVSSEQKELQSTHLEPAGEDENESQSAESGPDVKSDDDNSQFFQQKQDNGRKEVANLAAKVLESWSNLKEMFRIPRRENDQKIDEKDSEKKLFENSPDSSCSSGNGKERKVLLPTPDIKPGKRLRKSGFGGEEKQKRRMRFALEMQQKDEEDAIRRQEEELQRQKEEERQQNQANLIFAAATAMCNDPAYQPHIHNVAELFPPNLPPTELGINMAAQPPLPQDNIGVMYNPPQIPGPSILPQTVLPPPTVLPPQTVLPPPNVPPVSDINISYPPVPVPTQQQPPPYIQGPPMMLPPSSQVIPPIPTQYPPGIPLTHPPPQQPPQYIQQNIVPPRSAVPQMIAASVNDLHHQCVQTQGPQIFTAPPPGTPIYYIQHPGGQPTPVVIMPEAEVKDPAPPPPSPPKSRKDMLPPNWKAAKDTDGNTYYYHSITRKTQWDPPTWDQVEQVVEPSYPAPEKHKHSRKKSFSTTTAAADTSSELVKKTKELFRAKMSSHIVHCLNPFRKPDCKLGRVTSTEDFKHLARKLTHFVMAKELKYCQNVEDLECNENVKHKAKDFVNKYLTKYGPIYRKDKSSPKEY